MPMPVAALDLFDFSSVSATFYFGVRILLTILAGLIGWFVLGPTSAVLHRLAFQKPISGQSKFGTRLAGALIVAALAFFFIPLGGGRGPGPGGPGSGGYGTGGDQPGGGGKGSGPGGGNGDSNGTGIGQGGVLTVEIVAIKNYEDNSQKYYLIDAKEPARTLGEVEAILKQNKGKWARMNIIVYGNSFPPEGDIVVQPLVHLAERYKITHSIPLEYKTKTKPIKGMGQ